MECILNHPDQMNNRERENFILGYPFNHFAGSLSGHGCGVLLSL